LTVKRITIATVGYGGLEDHVSGEFGHSRTLTIVEVEDGVVRDVNVLIIPLDL
jgi:predicted Fe-Mo cluster-binding NifX family protein